MKNKIYNELVLIKKELQEIRNLLENLHQIQSYNNTRETIVKAMKKYKMMTGKTIL